MCVCDENKFNRNCDQENRFNSCCAPCCVWKGFEVERRFHFLRRIQIFMEGCRETLIQLKEMKKKKLSRKKNIIVVENLAEST